MVNKNKTICFGGHRTEKLPKSKDKFTNLLQELYTEIDKAIIEGYDTFMFGACYGFDLICAEQVLMRKQLIRYTAPESIKLIAVVPFEEQAAKWKEWDRDKYFNILSKCDDVITLNKHFKTGCYHERNRYMVDNSNKLICYYDGSDGGTRYTVEYAKNLKITYIEKIKIFLNKEETYERFIGFLDDAREVYIFGGDLNFLLESQKQFDEIKTLGNRCKIICEDVSRNINKKDIKELYKRLYDANVQIRCYNSKVKDNIRNFRGQLKYDNNGVLNSLFVKKLNKETYEPFNLDNQYLNNLLLNNFKNVFEKGKNPLIEYIIFDLGGVYFDGDYYEDFLNPVCSELKVRIPHERGDKLLLDSKLNLGEINITDYIQKKIPRCLSENEKEIIIKRWKNTWRPNSEIDAIIKNLTNNNYYVTVFSNIDKINGDMYKERGDFENFTTPLFLSYDYKKLKPSEDFFELVLSTLKAKPYEVLLIDDHEINTLQGSKLGMFVVQYSNNMKLLEKLKELGIIVEEDNFCSDSLNVVVN